MTDDQQQGDTGQQDDEGQDDAGVRNVTPDDGGEDGGHQDDGGTADVAALRKEAAAHRVKARKAEAEVARLAGVLDSMRRNEVERRAEAKLARGDDLWAVGGVELGDLVGEDGSVDVQRVDAAIAAVLAERPHLARRGSRPTGDADQGARETAPTTVSWAEALRAT